MGNITAEEDAALESKAAAPGVEPRWVTENALLLELPADDSDDEAYPRQSSTRPQQRLLHPRQSSSCLQQRRISA